MLNIVRVVLVIASIAFWPILMIWLPLELYYHAKASDKKMLKAADRLKKAIAEATELGFCMEDLGNGHLEADFLFEADDGRHIHLHLKDYDYEDDTEIGWFSYNLHYGAGSQDCKNMTKKAQLYSLADTFYAIQQEMKNDAYYDFQ
jgi:hypothetical protein